jgi:FAD/FMN-containing dehydrogenase
VNSDYGKNLRWSIEKLSAKLLNNKIFSRNQLQNDPVDVYRNADTAYTDILHEYFIPSDSVARFIERLQKILPGYQTDLLNITVRNVKKDKDSYLTYARTEVFGFVMLFSQARTSEAEAEMQRLTRHLVNISTLLGGTYYLPYRLHANKQQMQMAYPLAKNFFALKAKYDPHGIFRNLFYETYR